MGRSRIAKKKSTNILQMSSDYQVLSSVRTDFECTTAIRARAGGGFPWLNEKVVELSVSQT